MTQSEAVQSWFVSAEEAYQTAEDTFSKHPNWAFFFWHLSIEKLIKGLIVTKGGLPLPVHDLVKLTSKTGIILPDNFSDYLVEISSYAISARYDDIKKSFYRKVTNTDYSGKWSVICREVYAWFRSKY